MSEIRTVSGNRVAEVPLGLWPKVRARVRQARPWEMPGDVRATDRRMVEFWKTERGGWKGKGVSMLDLVGLYPPLREPDLLGEFIHLFGSDRPASERKVLEFYGRYGPLWEYATAEDERIPAWMLRLKPGLRAKLQPEARAGYCEPLWWLEEKARELRLTYDLYVALKEDRPESLRAILGAAPEGKVVVGAYIVVGQIVRDLVDEEAKGPRKAGSFSIEPEPPMGSSQCQLRPFTDDEARHWGRVVLIGQLNAAEARSSRRWFAREEILAHAYSQEGESDACSEVAPPDLVRVRTFEGLTTAFYLQIADLVERDAPLKCCTGCGRLFHPTRSDQVYCDARCGDATRRRTRYSARKRGMEPSASGRRPKAARTKRRAR